MDVFIKYIKLKIKNFLYISIGLLSLFLIYFSCLHTENIDERLLQKIIDTTSKTLSFQYKFEEALQCDNFFIVTLDNRVIFTKNINGKSMVFSYNINTKIINKVIKSEENLNKPFLFMNKIFCLVENNYTGKYKIYGDKLNIGNNDFIEELYHSKKGELLLIKYLNNSQLFILNAKTSKQKVVLDLYDNLNDVIFSDDGNIIIISIGEDLLLFNIKSSILKKLPINISGYKENCSINKSDIYFVSNINSLYYQIYKYNIQTNSLEIVLTSNHDLRLPKSYGKKLYFIEVNKSEYLLKSKTIGSNKIDYITKSGVVYNYQFVNNKIFYSYSDFLTPRCIKYFDNREKVIYNIECNSMKTNLHYQFIKATSNESSAYMIKGRYSKNAKGIILYFHPGKRNDDFSPRWENMIFPLCEKGFTVICPNFPTSSGYGKIHSNKSFKDAVLDMNYWKQKIIRDNPNVPIYYYGISSGCPIMEACIKFDSESIKAAISAFGIPNEDYESTKVPIFYILGEQDQIVQYENRKKYLTNLVNHNKRPIIVISFKNEGHLIRIPSNFYLMHTKLLTFLDNYQ